MATRRQRAIIHIGTEKTGSTSIQNVLAGSRDALLPLGFAYPVSPGRHNHTRLALFAGDSGRTKGLARRDAVAAGSGSGALRGWLERELAQEIEALPDQVQTVVFSNEHCHSRLVTPATVGRLHDLLAPHFDRLEVIVYLRRQDELAISRYSTALRTGNVSGEIFPARPDGRSWTYFDYAGMLDRWVQVFGRDAVRPRLFGREHFRDGDLILDFLDACGIAGLPLPEQEMVRNSSITPAAQDFLLRFNRIFARDPNKRRPAWIRDFLGQQWRGPGRLPPRAEAEAFCALFAEGNERIRAGWFPERESLFSADFSRYPEEDAPAATEAEVLEIALAVVAHLSEERDTRATALAARDAAAAAAEGEPAEEDEDAEAPPPRRERRALAAAPQAASAPPPAEAPPAAEEGEDERAGLCAALEADPGNLKALRRLVRMAVTPEDQAQAAAYVERAKEAAPHKQGVAVIGEKLGRVRRIRPREQRA